MKLLLALLIFINACAYSGIIPAELAAYQKYVERVAQECERDMLNIEKEVQEKGMTTGLTLKTAIFFRTYMKAFMQIRAMDVYTQSVIHKMTGKLIPAFERMALNVYREQQAEGKSKCTK